MQLCNSDDSVQTFLSQTFIVLRTTYKSHVHNKGHDSLGVIEMLDKQTPTFPELREVKKLCPAKTAVTLSDISLQNYFICITYTPLDILN